MMRMKRQGAAHTMEEEEEEEEIESDEGQKQKDTTPLWKYVTRLGGGRGV